MYNIDWYYQPCGCECILHLHCIVVQSRTACALDSSTLQVRYCRNSNSDETQHICFQCRLTITNAVFQPSRRHTWSPDSWLANRLTSVHDAFHWTIFDALLLCVTYYVIVTSTDWSRLRLLLPSVFDVGGWILLPRK